MKHWSSMSAHFLKYAIWAGVYHRKSFIEAITMSVLEGTTTQSLSSLNLTECLVLVAALVPADDGSGNFSVPRVLDSSSGGIIEIRSVFAMESTRGLR